MERVPGLMKVKIEEVTLISTVIETRAQRDSLYAAELELLESNPGLKLDFKNEIVYDDEEL